MASPTASDSTTASITNQLTDFHRAMVRAGITKVLIYVTLGIYLLWTLFPVYWMISATFKSRKEILAVPPVMIPTSLDLTNYASLFATRPGFYYFILNSVIITLCTTVFAVTVGTAATYGLVKFDFPYNAGEFYIPFFTLATRFLPPIIMVIPLFLIFRGVGLLDTQLVLILSYSSFSIPFVIWMMVGFFQELPDSIVEAAMIDGNTHFEAFFKIVLPLVKPGLIASTIFVLITAWNELMFAVILTRTLNAQTLPVALATFNQQFAVQWEMLSVASTIAMVPVIVFAFIVRKELIRGFTMGAVS